MDKAMSTRRALVVAPLYDGKWLPPLAGRPMLVERLRRCLEHHGHYDVKVLDRIVTAKEFCSAATSLFDSPGELMLYFYGHGCVGTAGLGYFATSDAEPFAEGVMMHIISALA